jgi:uncharacterized membrane protein
VSDGAQKENVPPVAATVHIYRGLMDRCYTWRTRIDNPTNWAIVTGGTVTSFVLGDATISHTVLLLVMFFNVAFLLIEARRYRYYDLWATWARLMETDFFTAALTANQATVGEAWHKLLVRDMIYPHFKTTMLSAVKRRLRDNYLVIFVFLLCTWLLKLIVHRDTTLGELTLMMFVQSAAIGPLPGEIVFSCVALGYALLLVLALALPRDHEPGVEVASRARVLRTLASPHQQPVHRRQDTSELHPLEMSRPSDSLHQQRPLDLED